MPKPYRPWHHIWVRDETNQITAYAHTQMTREEVDAAFKAPGVTVTSYDPCPYDSMLDCPTPDRVVASDG